MSIHSVKAAQEKSSAQPNPTAEDTSARDAMDQMYRFTRHIYDATRKYYLLGRDHLIDHLDAKPGEHICESGCGTARNLIKLAKYYPQAHFYGIDASDEMLKTAQINIEKSHVPFPIHVKQSYAQSFNPSDLFGLQKPFDKIIFSYSLSIIPPWRESIDHALTLLKSGGEIHIIDFGGQEGLPAAFRAFLFGWLKMFHVFYKPEIATYLRKLEQDGAGILMLKPLYKGYATYAVFKKK